MLSGRHPYEGLDFLQVYHLTLNKSLEGIKGVSKEVNEVIKKVLSKDPKNRYHSAKKFFEEFEDATKGVSISSDTGVYLSEKHPRKIWKDPYLGMEFIYVPGGSFEMGDVFGDGYKHELPVHRVELDGFWMGRYPVTVGQWKRFIDDAGYEWDLWSYVKKISPSEKHPIVGVSWHDAKAFARWLSEKTGYLFRLPTEAEWEYAARSCGKKVKYATATGKLSYDLANYDGDRHPIWEYTSPVGSFPPNPLGLYDMSGNVWEWCEDWYDRSYYSRSPRNNPQGPSSGVVRVLRGGSWDVGPRSMFVVLIVAGTGQLTVASAAASVWSVFALLSKKF